ncbi:D-alanyl-D-alanine carboxypeptidase family protein [Fictibacillus iocasae]|uniref:D-alanyl-D-alanine carboxypeptidase family protein n=1 Tax=Fictibacillus iocasae TaxID=2715437 RepID=A0ABW2NUD4_9BACL
MKWKSLAFIGFSAVLLTGCSMDIPFLHDEKNAHQEKENEKKVSKEKEQEQHGSMPADPEKEPDGPINDPAEPQQDAKPPKTDSEGQTGGKEGKPPETENSTKDGAIQVVANPDIIDVLINKFYSLPESYEPANLVYLNVPFIFEGKAEKTMMRQEAAEALERMFSDAKKEGVTLLGVSAYRSHETQKALFQRYVDKDGYEKARTYSAVPGTSEHETGLAIDVTGGDGSCPAQDCFGEKEEAKWLKKHAADYGFIIRYPEGKEKITGYKYEPWHLRYVGKQTAVAVSSRNITLEEYFNAVPVSN